MKNEKKNNFYYVLIPILCCGFTAASVGVSINSYGVFFTPVSEALGVGRGSISMHATISGLVMAVAGPFVIKIFNKYKFRPVMITAVIMALISTLGMAYANEVWMFNVLSIFRGLGLAFFHIPIASVLLGFWFHKNLGTITGVVSSFSGVAGALCSPLFTSLIEKYGYQTAYIIMMLLVALLALPGAIFCIYKPENIGMKPYTGKEKLESTSEDTAPSVASAQKENVPGEPGTFVIISMGIVATIACLSTCVTSHITGYAENLGLTATFGSYLLSIIMIANISFKFLIGVLIDRLGAIKASLVPMVLTFIGVAILLTMPSSKLLLMLAAFLLGTVYSFGSVALALVTRAVVGIKRFPSVFAIYAMLSSFATSIYITLIGYSVDHFGSYSFSLVVCLVSLAISAVLLVVISRKSASHK